MRTGINGHLVGDPYDLDVVRLRAAHQRNQLQDSVDALSRVIQELRGAVETLAATIKESK